MKRFLLMFALVATTAAAQYNLPPGTSSSVPDAEQAPRSTPEDAPLRHAEEAIGASKFDEAVRVLAPLATAQQRNERVFYDLAFAQDALSHDAEAEANYKRAIALNGNDAAARVSLGLLEARTDHREAAEEQLAAAVKVPHAAPVLLARAYRALAQMHVERNLQQADDELVAALKVSTETPEDAVLAADIADALHDDAAASKAYAHALQVNPGDAALSVAAARVLARQQRFDEARRVLDAAAKAHSDDRSIVAEQASQQMLQGHAEEAVPALEQLHKAEPRNAPIALLLARAYTDAGTPEKADGLYTALLAAAPDDPALLAEAGDHLIREKRSAEAEPLLQKAVANLDKLATPKAKADALGELAFAASANHDAETVLQALSTRQTMTNADAPYTFLAATAHDTLHHTKQAADAYRLFVQQSAGKFPDQEWQAKQRLQILDRQK